jgi:hypothetical protein
MAVWHKSGWSRFLLGLLTLAGLCIGLMLFHHPGVWHHQRNANLIVPLYLCGFKAFIDIKGNALDVKDKYKNPSFISAIVLTCCMLSVVFYGSNYYDSDRNYSHFT